MNSIYQQKIIDTHIHLWDLQKYSYDWIANTSNKDLKKNYLLGSFIKDSNSLNIKKTVHVQAGINSNLNIEETKWLQFIADNNSRGIPNAIVGFVDLVSKKIEQELDQHMQFSNFRGIRQILKHDQKELINESNLLKNNKWINNLQILEKNNLSFDLLIIYHQFKEAAKVIYKYPNLQFIVNHTLWPQDVSTENFALWQDSIKALSEFDNVSIKLSGFGERDSMWEIENIKPFINYSIEKFGVERCMFGTNFPVDKAFSSKTYFDYWDSYHTITSHLSLDEKDSLFFKNAEKYYKI